LLFDAQRVSSVLDRTDHSRYDSIV
jgi:hypothetical protein